MVHFCCYTSESGVKCTHSVGFPLCVTNRASRVDLFRYFVFTRPTSESTLPTSAFEWGSESN